MERGNVIVPLVDRHRLRRSACPISAGIVDGAKAGKCLFPYNLLVVILLAIS